MIRTDLLGWTLAELALALLFALLAVFGPSFGAEVRRIKLLEAQSKNAISAAEAEKLRAENLALREEIDASRKNLKSRITPPCAELDKNSSWLFTATVRSRDSFGIAGKTLSMQEILREYAKPLADAKKRGCVQQVHVNFQAGISAGDFDYAFRRLGSYFYPASLGEER